MHCMFVFFNKKSKSKLIINKLKSFNLFMIRLRKKRIIYYTFKLKRKIPSGLSGPEPRRVAI
jgi:hypothetical protein